MASTGINNGTITALYIYVSNVLTKVAHLTGNDISQSTNMIGTSSKNSDGWEEVIGGQKSWEFSGSGFFAEDATGIGYEELWDYWQSGQKLLVVQSSQVTGDKFFKGQGYITSLSRSMPVEDAETFDVSIKGTGTLSKFTVS